MLIWLLGTAAICWHAATQFTPRVEDRILSRVQSVLTPITTTSTPVVASVHGRDATLTGRAMDKQQRANLIAAVEGIPGVRSVVDQLTLLEPEPATDKNGLGDSTRDSDVSGSTDETPTLTVIDSSSSETESETESESESESESETETETETESESESAIKSAENSLTDDNAFTNDNSARSIASTANEFVNTDANLPADTDAEFTADPRDPILEVSPEASDHELWPAEIEDELSLPESESADTNSNLGTVAVEEPIDESDVLFSFVETKSEPESPSLLAPSLDFNIQGKTLAVSGKISNKDDIAPLIRSAMISFDLDYISNTIELSDDIGNASWLESVSDLLPDMAGLENPSIEINADDIHLGGSAPNAETQEAVLGAAVSLLGAYNMSEEIALKNPDSPATIVDESTSSTVTQAPAVSNESIEVADSDTTATATATANDTNITTTEDSDAIGTPSDQSDDNVKPSQSAIPAAALSNALSDLPSMDILFESSSDILTIDSLDVLDSIANVLLDHPDIPIRIEGHTDASGTEQENLILSQLRANSVRDYLIDRGVSIYRLKAYGFGEGVPISDNSTPEGRADNRRIEFNVQR